MNRFLKLLILLILFLCIFTASVSVVLAQPKSLQFVHHTPGDGLSSSIISAIIQDHRGFMWIGTPDGLNRYDGIKYVVYKNIPEDSTSLINNGILTLFVDHSHNLFIGTDAGLCLYNRDNDSFLNYFYDKSSPLKGIICSVATITEDTVGNLWLATDVGLIYFNRNKNQIVRFNHDPNNPASLSSDNVESVMIDKKSKVWVTTRKGLNKFISETATFQRITHAENGNEDLSNTVFSDMIEDKQENLWFGSTEGVYCLENGPNTRSGNLIHYKHDSQDKTSISINQVISLFVDAEGNLWIGTENGGINLFNYENKSFRSIRRDDYDAQSLSNESIEAIYQDRTGNMWFGTFAGGLNIATKNRDAVSSYQYMPGAEFSLSHNSVTGFLEDHLGQIWVGTDGGGLNRFDRQNKRFLRYNTENSNLNSNSILCILETSDNQIWLGTWAGGLVKFDPKTRSFASFTTKNSDIPDDNIFAITEGDNEDLWLGSFEHGLLHYQIKENKFSEFAPAGSGLANAMVVKINKLSGGRLLVGTVSSLYIFSTIDNHVITYVSEPDNQNSININRVTDMLIENDTCFWIGTPDGLNRFNPSTGSFIRYFEKNGLPENFIKALALDEKGALWGTTNKGAFSFDYKTGRFKNFTKADGLQANEFSERSILRTNDGSLLIGGTTGFNILIPEKTIENKNIPDVLITDLKIFNKSVRPGGENSPLKQNITETEILTLNHDKSVLSFSFAIMDFTAPEKNQYAYKMENFDQDWYYSGNKAEATYTNLSPGKYTLRVKGSNNDGLWNEQGTSLIIIILPPWWNTLWFKLIIIATILLISTAIPVLRFRQLKNQKTLLEKTVALKTAELFELNASKDKFFSIIAHDLKNPFNTIIGFSEILKESAKSEASSTIYDYAAMINTSAVQTFRLLENLLEWANTQRGKISFSPKPVCLNEIIREEFVTANEMATSKNIELKSYITDTLTVMVDKNMIKAILRNLIINAVKFTYKNGKVGINAIKQNNHLEIAVSDNGIGMNKDIMGKLFRIDANLSTRGTENEKGTGLGLFLCKEFVEKHGGRIWVESEEGKGSTFKFSLPAEVILPIPKLQTSG